MEERYKTQLEGLLQARSQDIRHGLRPRRRRLVTASVLEPPASLAESSYEVSDARRCEECGAEIGTRRLRAMPQATLCLDCRRAAELAGAAS